MKIFRLAALVISALMLASCSLLSMEPPMPIDPFTEYMPWKADGDRVVKTASGLQYIVLDSGDAKGVSPKPGQMVTVHYAGRLASTNRVFDSSIERGEPAVFPSDRLIKGWVEALAMMKPGDRWFLYIPAGLGYGETGTPGGPIPPNADLVFEVQLIAVKP